MKPIAYYLTCEFTNEQMQDGATSLIPCIQCGLFNDVNYINDNLVPPKRKLDFGVNLDWGYVISLRVKECLDSLRLPGVHTPPLKRSNGRYFHLIVCERVAFDTERRGTRFEYLCSDCGRFRYVVGARPMFLLDTSRREHGMWRTDIELGSDNAKHYRIIVGVETFAQLEALGLKDIVGLPVFP